MLGLGALLIGGMYLIVTATSPAPTPPAAVPTPTPAAQPVAETTPAPAPPAATSVPATMPKPVPTPVKTPPVQSKPIIAAQSNRVTIHDYSFLPATLTVKKGTTVTWTNDDIAKHTVTGDHSGPSSDFFGQGQSYSYTFDAPGTYPYHCEPHPYMTATVVVTE